MFGCGLLPIWCSGLRARRRRAAATRIWVVRSTDLLRQAGVDGVGPAQLLGVELVCAVVSTASPLLHMRPELKIRIVALPRKPRSAGARFALLSAISPSGPGTRRTA
jgi:hypothetical protein